jgi:hypothetical protein
MKNLSAHLMVFGVATALAINAEATTIVQKPNKKVLAAAAVAAAVPSTASLELLRDAYDLLYVADHDYKGHRARAMHQIEDAFRMYGAKLRGQGKGKEVQRASDAQLREAQSKLEQSLGGLAGKPALHIQNAIKQLNIALRVK